MTQDINTMTDAELVAAVAREVKPEGVCQYASGDEWIMCSDGCPSRRWKPLESWEDCMMVVDAMRSEGWRWSYNEWLSGNADSFDTHFIRVADAEKCFRVRGKYGNECRAILQAALEAVRAEGGSK